MLEAYAASVAFNRHLSSACHTSNILDERVVDIMDAVLLPLLPASRYKGMRKGCCFKLTSPFLTGNCELSCGDWNWVFRQYVKDPKAEV